MRPGRVDMKAKIDYCSHHQLQQMFQRFYPQEDEQACLEFATKVQSIIKNISAAQVQGYFMFHKDSAKSALANVESMVRL